jgi:pimeloyl-ACP methyl ester carboxylesterase
LNRPDRVRALLLVDAGGYPRHSTDMPIAFRVARWPVLPSLLAAFDPRPFVEDGIRRSYGDPSRVTADVIQRYYELALRPGNRDAFVDRMRAPNPDQSARISELRMPALVLWGERDRLIPAENARRYGADIPGARVVTYSDLGHVPMEEDPTRTVADVEPFLAGLPETHAD